MRPERTGGPGRGLHLVVLIIRRSAVKQAMKQMGGFRMPVRYLFYARKLGGTPAMEWLGLSESEQAVVLSFAHSGRLRMFLAGLARRLHIEEKADGILFSVPISAAAVPERRGRNHRQAEIEREADKVSRQAEYDLIVAVVPEGQQTEVIQAARWTGVSHGTVFPALQPAMEEAGRFFGFPLQQQKDIVTILVPRSSREPVMDTISACFPEEQRILLFTLPADHVFGIAGE